MVAVKKQAAVAKSDGVSPLTKVVKKIKKSDALKKAKESTEYRKGIIMINHLPHGFYEKELSEYFGQYGKVLRVKVARSKKTGNSKGYAYVQFQLEEVAKIAAESLDGYLMFERLIKCKLLGPEANPKRIFADSYIRKGSHPGLEKEQLLKAHQATAKSAADQRALLEARVLNLHRQNAKLASLGIDYQFSPPDLPSLVQSGANEEIPASTIKLHGRKPRKPKVEAEKKSKALKKTKAKGGLSEVGLAKVLSESPKVAKAIKKKPKAKKLVNAPVNAATPKAPQQNISPDDDIGIPAIQKQATPKKGKSPLQPKPKSPKAEKSPLKSKAKSPKIEKSTPQSTAKSPEVEKTPLNSKVKSPKVENSTPQSKAKSPKAKKLSVLAKAESPKVIPENFDLIQTPGSSTSVVESGEASPGGKKLTAKQRKSQERAAKYVADNLAKSGLNSPAQIVSSPGHDNSLSGTKLTPKERKSLKLAQKKAQDSPIPQPQKSPKLKKSIETAQLATSPVPVSPKGKSPHSKKRKSEENSNDSQGGKSPKTPKLSLTKEAEVDMEAEVIPASTKKAVNKKAGKKSEESKAKMSPKLLRSKNRQSEIITQAEIEQAMTTTTADLKKQKSPVDKKGKVKFSPKVLRSKGKKSENFSDTLNSTTLSEIADQVKPSITPKATKAAGKKGKGNASPSGGESQKSPILPKEKKLPAFSPKLLRSRGGRQSESSPAVSVAGTGKPTRGRKSMK